ncbi:MAG: di-trans,poly-cis-decaprenylcistransferase [Lachnospiraceae bacterium]|nr:di-trans,poly-cis-decaprenylcistransferase [Lachnospiraceae bacterium]
MSELQIPASVAIIMDGNGRWAKKRGLPRTFGHKEGCKAIEALIPEAGKLGIRYLTVYAFSTENWKRSEEEVSGLMDLFRYYASRLLKSAKEHNVRIRMIGDRRRFPQDIIDAINMLEQETRENTGLTFVMAANYGGRDELRRAAMRYAKALQEGTVPPEAFAGKNAKVPEGELTEEGFAAYLDTAGIPDPDLVIRTSGELRLSNFLVWQAAYSEIVITDTLWPDFNIEELKKCIEEFNHRNRRFGGV